MTSCCGTARRCTIAAKAQKINKRVAGVGLLLLLATHVCIWTVIMGQFAGALVIFGSGFKRSHTTELVILVLSSRRNFDVRQTVRQTWGTFRGATVRFLVGREPCKYPEMFLSDDGPCILDEGKTVPQPTVEAHSALEKDITKNLLEEAATFKDLILLDIVDTYGNLAEKTKSLLKWCASEKPYAWCLKVDDDVFVNVDVILSHLAALNPNELRLIGHIEKNVPVERSGKWAEHKYQSDTYPTYPQGSTGYILSPALVKRLSDHYDELEPFRCEDTSLGIWLNQLNLNNETMVFENHIGFPKFQNFYKSSCLETSTFSDLFVVSHRLSSKTIMFCFKQKLGEHKDLILDMQKRLRTGHRTSGSWRAGAKRRIIPLRPTIAVIPPPSLKPPKIMILVFSRTEDQVIRSLVREHWKQSNGCLHREKHLHCELLFVVRQSISFTQELQRETISNRDLILINMDEENLDNGSIRAAYLTIALTYILPGQVNGALETGSAIVSPVSPQDQWVLVTDTRWIVNGVALSTFSERLDSSKSSIYCSFQRKGGHGHLCEDHTLMLSPKVVLHIAGQDKSTPEADMLSKRQFMDFVVERTAGISDDLEWKPARFSSVTDPCVGSCCLEGKLSSLTFGPLYDEREVETCSVPEFERRI